MNAKKLIVIVVGGVLCVAVIYGIYMYMTREVVQPRALAQNNEITTLPTPEPSRPVVTTQKEEEKPKFDLYSSTPYDMPLYSVTQIAQISPKAKKTVDKLFEEAQGFYFLKYDSSKNKTFIILQNPISSTNTFSRHDIEIAEVSEDGTSTLHRVGYSGHDGEILTQQGSKDEWVLDESSKPLKHVAHDENGDVKFVEVWSYDASSPIKYEMKNSNGKVLSIIKETGEGETNYRKEHVFYDNDGKTKLSITVNYDGANISRFTYYNSADDIDSVSVISDYNNDGSKTGEKIYNENYELLNSLQADYENGDRKNIRIYNKDGQVLSEFSS